jgi:hypothetical protein
LTGCPEMSCAAASASASSVNGEKAWRLPASLVLSAAAAAD